MQYLNESIPELKIETTDDKSSQTSVPLYINSTTSSQPESQNSFFNMYTAICFGIIGFIIALGMVSAIVIYKIKTDYLLKRQVNQLKRIDRQLGIERIYKITTF